MNFVLNAGPNNRTLFAVNAGGTDLTVLIGCFSGTFKEARQEIKLKYHGRQYTNIRRRYLLKLDLLELGGDNWECFPWSDYDAAVTLLKYSINQLDVSSFDFDKFSHLFAIHAPLLKLQQAIQEDKLDWSGNTSLTVLKRLPEVFDRSKADWRFILPYVRKECPELEEGLPNKDRWVYGVHWYKKQAFMVEPYIITQLRPPKRADQRQEGALWKRVCSRCWWTKTFQRLFDQWRRLPYEDKQNTLLTSDCSSANRFLSLLPLHGIPCNVGE